MRDGVKKVKEHGATWREEDVYLMLRTGQAYLHMGFRGGEYRGFVITQQHQYPEGLCLHIWAAYSTKGASLLEDGMDQITEWGRNMKAKRITFYSPRKGWDRVGRQLGFEPSTVIYQRVI